MNKNFIGVILALFVITGGAFLAVLHWGSQLNPPENILPITTRPPAPIIVIPTPSVDLSIEKSKGGNILRVRWSNLPQNTLALDIFRSTKGKKNWVLWKVVDINSGNAASGSAGFNISNSDFLNYQFYLEAVSGNGGGGNGTSTPGNVLWQSPITNTGSGNGNPPPPPPPGQGNNGTPTSSAPTSTTNQNPTSTPPPPPPPPNSTSSGNNGGTVTPSGTPYYSPEIQISGYGSARSSTFWVQHVDQKIEIGWQNLPPITDNIAVSRSSNQGGPWTMVLAQNNPGVNGRYSIQIVDNTVGQTFYYMMNALVGSTTVATYGPVYLPPIGQ